MINLSSFLPNDFINKIAQVLESVVSSSSKSATHELSNLGKNLNRSDIHKLNKVTPNLDVQKLHGNSSIIGVPSDISKQFETRASTNFLSHLEDSRIGKRKILGRLQPR